MSDTTHSGFAGRFRQALQEAGYADTQLKVLGELFGVTGQAVRKWLHGEALPNSSRAASVAEKLGVRRAWLLDGEPPMRAIRTELGEEPETYHITGGQGLSISSEEYRLLRNYRALPHELQAYYSGILESTIKALGNSKQQDS